MKDLNLLLVSDVFADIRTCYSSKNRSHEYKPEEQDSKFSYLVLRSNKKNWS
jgi:hypothetical protein